MPLTCCPPVVVMDVMDPGIVHGRRSGETPRYTQELAALLRIIVVAGVPVGVVVIGGGSRLAMFLLRLTSPDFVMGLESDDGFTIGQFTFVDSYNLLNLGGALGIVGAAACVAVAPWLVGPRWFRLFTVGLTAAALVGSMVIVPDGVDFRVLGPTWLAVALFTALPFITGVALMLAIDREATVDTWASRGRRRQWVVPAVLLLAVPLSVFAFLIVGVVVAALLPVRRRFLAPLSASPWGPHIIRAVFVTIPVVSFLALADDLRALY